MSKIQKYMFVSDIHGNIEIFNKIIEIFKTENADKLVILGDTSAGYYSEENNELIAEILNEMQDKVEVIHGNCDTSDFEELLDFETYDDDTLYINGVFVTITHGHLYGSYNLPQICGKIYIQGHTHAPLLMKQGERIIANPGSPTRPRGTDLKCYIIIDEKTIKLKEFNGVVINEIFFGD